MRIHRRFAGKHATRVGSIWRCSRAWAFVAVNACLAPALALAAPQPSASAEVGTNERELPALPAIPKLEPAPPTAAEASELSALLDRLVADNADDRSDAMRDALEVRSKLVPALLARLDKLASGADRERMKRAMAQARERPGRASEPSESGASGSSGTRSDLLKSLLDKARPKDAGWRELTELIAISRMLTSIGTVQAARGLIEIYVRFGEFMRVDVQNRLADLKDGAVPALIEARRHRAEKIAHWADRQLDRLGKGVPGEAIRTDNFEILADVLRAYGRVKDPDAARIIISYANSERYQVREAARQAIVMLGEIGIWQLREAYENVAGKRPRRDWSWERTARELFFELDRLHVVKAYELLEQGRIAASERRFDDMVKAYDVLLARSPQFEKAATLAPGYFEYAKEVASKHPEAAKAALVRVERLASDASLRQRARSMRETLEASDLATHGVIDAYALSQALEQDPSNQAARRLLASGDQAQIDAQTARTRWLTSGAIGLVALAAILFVLLRPRGERQLPNAKRDGMDVAGREPNAKRDGMDVAGREPNAERDGMDVAGREPNAGRDGMDVAGREPNAERDGMDVADREPTPSSADVPASNALSERGAPPDAAPHTETTPSSSAAAAAAPSKRAANQSTRLEPSAAAPHDGTSEATTRGANDDDGLRHTEGAVAAISLTAVSHDASPPNGSDQTATQADANSTGAGSSATDTGDVQGHDSAQRALDADDPLEEAPPPKRRDPFEDL